MDQTVLSGARGAVDSVCPSTPPADTTHSVVWEVPGSAGSDSSSLGHLLMPPQDQKRMEKISKRVSAIEEVNNNVKLLTEMVMSHSQGGASACSSEDLMKVRLSPPCPRPSQGPCRP